MNIKTATEKYYGMYKHFQGPKTPRKLPGEAAECILRELVRTHIDHRCGVGYGLVVSDNRRSREQDLILFKKHSALFEVGDLVVVPSLDVIAVVQVKSWQTTMDISNVAANLESVYKLNNCIATYAFFWTFYSRRQFESAAELRKKHRLNGIYGMCPCPNSAEQILGPEGIVSFLDEIMRVAMSFKEKPIGE